MDFERAFRLVSAFSRRHGLLAGGERVLVAISGGADSTLLLRLFRRFGSSHNLALAAGHVNHSLRGDASLEDEKFCAGLAASAGIPFFCSTLESGELSLAAEGSLEEAARIRRYRELGRFASEWKADVLATGHHGGDLAETLLLNLLRGTSFAGLGGIRPLAPAPESGLPLIRPMLCLSGEDVAEIVRVMKLDHRVDATNADIRFKRNRIRRLLLPFLSENFGAGVEKILARSALLASENASILRELTASDLESASTRLPGSSMELDLKVIRPLGRARIKLILHAALAEILGTGADIEAAHLEQAADLALREGGSAELTLTGGVRVAREYDRILIEKAAAAAGRGKSPRPGVSSRSFPARHHTDEADPGQDPGKEEEPIVITGPGRFETFAGDLTVMRHEAPAGFRMPAGSDRSRLFVRSASVEFPFSFRRIKSGDVFEPFGLGGRKKVRRFLMDRKVPLRLRADVPVIEDGGGIFWVAGHERDNRVEPPSPGESYLLFVLEPKTV